MKALFSHKIQAIVISLVIIAGSAVVGIILGRSSASKEARLSSENNQLDDYVKLGQDSFGLDVCTEMSREVVARTINQTVISIEDYTSKTLNQCKYYLDNERSKIIVIEAGYSAIAEQKNQLTKAGREIKKDNRFKLDNFYVAVNDEITDVYLTVDPTYKYIHIGRLGSGTIDSETLMLLALKTEEKVRSYQ